MISKVSVLTALSALLLITPVLGASPEEKGTQIAIDSDKANNGFKGESSSMKMILINAHGDRVERKMDSKIIETKDDGDKSVVIFSWPADVKGTKMLTWTHKVGNDDQWLYLPALKRVKRISSRSKSGSFMGSEFSYEDLGSQEVEKYKYKYLKDEKLAERDTWVLERIPVDKKSGYSKQVLWMDKEYKNVVKVDYFDRKGELLKTANFKGYKKYEKWWRTSEIEMINHQTKKSSILVWSNRLLNKTFPGRTFHKKSLKD